MAVPTSRERRFVLRLRANRAGDDWGFSLEEVTGGRVEPVSEVPVGRAGRYRATVLKAVTGSGYPAVAVTPRRKRHFNLTCETGVRLALTAQACEPVAKPGRRQAIADGVAAMTTEEALYWYALVHGLRGSTALRALRVLLAG